MQFNFYTFSSSLSQTFVFLIFNNMPKFSTIYNAYKHLELKAPTKHRVVMEFTLQLRIVVVIRLLASRRHSPAGCLLFIDVLRIFIGWFDWRYIF